MLVAGNASFFKLRKKRFLDLGGRKLRTKAARRCSSYFMFSQTHLYKYNVHIWLNMYYIYICLGTCYPIGWSRLVTSNRPCEQAASLEQAKLPATSPTSFPGCMLAPQVKLKGSGTPVANSRLYQPKQPSVNFQSGKSHIFQNNLGHSQPFWVVILLSHCSNSGFGFPSTLPTPQDVLFCHVRCVRARVAKPLCSTRLMPSGFFFG